MSAKSSTKAKAVPPAPAAHHDDHAGHPTDKQYIMIAVILAALTAIEVGLYYFELGAVNNYVLLILAAGKFVLVGLYFMHLKFDNRLLRQLFLTGIVLAIFCYFLVFLMFRIF